MNILCYGITYLFEQFIAYQYFSHKFDKKKKSSLISLAYLISFILQFSISFFSVPYLNLISFFLLNFIVSKFCYNINLKQNTFNVFLLTSIMIFTELLAMYSFTTIFKIDLLACKDDELILFLETIATKILYFLVAYLFSKFAQKETNNKIDYSILLFTLPAASIVTIVSFTYLSFTIKIEHSINILFVVISLILLSSNIIIFYIHERIIDTLTTNSELQLENQKNEINKEHYTELERQYDASNILIHDIKRHLQNIKDLSQNNGIDIPNYIDSIYDGYQINSLKQFSKNKLVNVIISRYSNLCLNHGINFIVDIRDVDFSFISDSDLTSLLDNLLENAYEATKAAAKKEIKLNIDRYNEKYLLIKLSNYSDTAPIIVENRILSTKSNKKHHGIGTKVIGKIVKKYYGDIDYQYNDEHRQFVVTILIKN